jgi:acetolactate synthase I/II/III large subunit
VHGADLVVFVGCDTGDQVTLNWTVPPRDTKIVQIDADPLEIGRTTRTRRAWSAIRKRPSLA